MKRGVARFVGRILPVAAATGGAAAAANELIRRRNTGNRRPTSGGERPVVVPTGIPLDDVVREPDPVVEETYTGGVPDPTVETDILGGASDDDDYLFSPVRRGFTGFEIADRGGELPVVRPVITVSRVFMSFITLAVGVAVGVPVVVYRKRHHQGPIDPPIDGGGGQIPDTNPDDVVPGVNGGGRFVNLCQYHRSYFEDTAFCPFCDKDGRNDVQYECVLFSDVPDEHKFGERLVPSAVFPPYLFNVHHYKLVNGVLICSCGKHRPRSFKSEDPRPDIPPFNTDFVYLVDGNIYVEDGEIVGVPVFSSYGYFEGYSLPIEINHS